MIKSGNTGYILRNILLTAGTMLVLAVIVLKSFIQPPYFKNLSVQEVRAKIKSQESDYILVDVRSAHEYNGQQGHLPGALLFPLQNLDIQYDELRRYRDSTEVLILYGGSGNRSRRAAHFLTEHGFENIYNMEGGMEVWNDTYGRPQTGDHPPPNLRKPAGNSEGSDRSQNGQ